jgi:uncharacterized membrane protein
MARTGADQRLAVTTAVTPEQMRSKEPAASVVAGPYGHPVHPILVTIPIGTWIASLVFDIASRSSDDPATFARGATWLIGIGIIGAAAAALFGLIDFLRIPRGTKAWTTGLTHLGLNVVVLALFVISWALRQSDTGYPETSVGRLVLSIVALLLLATSGVLGGMLSYRYGVRVADEATQATGFTSNRTAPAGPAPSGAASAH